MAARRKFLIFAIIGRSGAGKGAQAALLAKQFGLRAIVTGDLFRDLAKQRTPPGKSVKRMITAGGLPPGWLASYLWLKEIMGSKRMNKGLVFEGTPRRLDEAVLMDAVFPIVFGTRATPIFIDVSEKEARWRLVNRRICRRCKRPLTYYPRPKNLRICRFCGGMMARRKDDTPQAIRRRMQFYKTAVVPVLRYYRRQGRLTRVNGEQPIADVFEELLSKIRLSGI